MEALDILEKKIGQLLVKIKNLNEEVQILREENIHLQDKVDQLSSNLVNGQKELSSEKEKAKMFVEGLIQSIDSLVETEQYDG
ncbi:hypothetical protein A3F06_04255 [candidate division TM6 bacterium RIFCSPHIGHO2_12_FULL_36_22]|nr:MAG: hypothetical protein A3F06_04255 [candidate division TM6 bacterium RIFCSPHIGHO2_12_FULL_36_22]